MKKDWEIKKLGEILKLEYGKPLPEEKRTVGGCFPVYGANGLKGRSNVFYYDKKTIVVGRKGSAGEINLTEEKFWPLDVTYFVTFNEKKYDLLFLFHLLTLLDLPKLAKGVKPGINRNEVYNLEVCIPPLTEQQRIVSTLDECFSAIEKAKANAEQNLQNAKELFESYLQGVFENGNLKTKNGEWRESQLKDVALVFGRGKSKHRPRNWEGLFGGNYPFIQTGEVRNANKYVFEYSRTYSDVGLAQSKLWKKGTICITIAANIAETAILGFDACIPDSIIGLQIDPKKADLDFTYYLLQYYKTDLQKLGKGSAQDNINLGTFENRLFPFPPLKEQQTIVHHLDTLRTETQKLELMYQNKIANLEELKKSILRKAFAGELTEKTIIV